MSDDDAGARRDGRETATMATTTTMATNDGASAKTLVMRQTHEAVEKSACARTRDVGSRARERGALSFRSVEGGAAKARARDEIDRLTEARSVDARA